MPLNKKHVYIILYIITILIFQELLFRFLFPLPELKNFNRAYYSQIQISHLTKKLIKKSNFQLRNSIITFKSSLDSNFVEASLNNYGFRDKNWEINKTSENKRIMFIGDSFLEGEMSKDEEIIPKEFEKKVKQDNISLDLMNFGITGSGFYTYMRLIVDAAPIFKPDYIIILFYSQDLYIDFIPHILHPEGPPKPFIPEYYNPFKPRLIELFSEIYQKKQIFFRWNHKKYNYYPTVPDSVNPWTRNENKLSKWVDKSIIPDMKKGNFNPWAVNTPIIEENTLRIPIDITPELTFLKNYVSNYGCKLLVAYLPPREQITTYYRKFDKKLCLPCSDSIDLTTEKYQIHIKNLTDNCRSLNIPFCNLIPNMKKQEENGNHLYFNYNLHLNNKGTKIVGDELYKFWKITDIKTPHIHV